MKFTAEYPSDSEDEEYPVEELLDDENESIISNEGLAEILGNATPSYYRRRSALLSLLHSKGRHTDIQKSPTTVLKGTLGCTPTQKLIEKELTAVAQENKSLFEKYALEDETQRIVNKKQHEDFWNQVDQHLHEQKEKERLTFEQQEKEKQRIEQLVKEVQRKEEEEKERRQIEFEEAKRQQKREEQEENARYLQRQQQQQQEEALRAEKVAAQEKEERRKATEEERSAGNNAEVAKYRAKIEVEIYSI